MKLTDSIRNGEFLLSEGNGSISRDEVTLGAGAFVPGMVLGKRDTNGSYYPLDPAKEDGSQVAAAICWGVYAGTKSGAVVVKRLAEVQDSKLTWPDDITPENKALAIEQLETAGIVVR